MAIAISKKRIATPYLYQGSWGTGVADAFVVCTMDLAVNCSPVQLGRFFSDQSARQQAVFFGVALVSRGPEVEEYEWHE